MASGQQLRGLLVAQEQVGEDALGQAGRAQRLGEALARQRGLGGVLEEDGIAGEEGRHDRVGGGEEGIVPGGDHQHEAGGHPHYRTSGFGTNGASAAGARSTIAKTRSASERYSPP